MSLYLKVCGFSFFQVFITLIMEKIMIGYVTVGTNNLNVFHMQLAES